MRMFKAEPVLMEMSTRRPFLVGLVGVVLLLGCAPAAPQPASFPSPLLGKELPSVRGSTVAGGQVRPEDLKGRPVVIKFFAKYCEPCKRTLPAAQQTHVRHSDVMFLGVSEDERMSEASEIVDLYGLTFPVVHDRSNVLSGRFRVSELPVTFVVDRRGVVRYVLGPDHDEHVLDRVLDSLD